MCLATYAKMAQSYEIISFNGKSVGSFLRMVFEESPFLIMTNS
jgi:hypothetical protein